MIKNNISKHIWNKLRLSNDLKSFNANFFTKRKNKIYNHFPI